MLAKAGPNGDPIATPSTCLLYLLLNIKKDSLVAMLSKLRKSCFGMLGDSRCHCISCQQKYQWFRLGTYL